MFSQERQAYLKLEKDDPVISVYTKPGLNWKYCEKNAKGECIDAIGWLDKDSKVWVTGPKVTAKTIDPLTNKEVVEEYYPVQFEYTREAGGKSHVKTKGPIGYIDAAYVDFEKVRPIYSPKKNSDDKSQSCDGRSKSEKALEDLKCELELKNLEETAKLLKDRIGFCASLKDDKDKKANLYDNVILKKIKSMDPPRLQDESGNQITSDQMIEVDSLARTLYGEMASCYKHGLEYPMAVARIAINRGKNRTRHKEFIRGVHASNKPALSKVVTSPSQFSIWLRKLNGVKNPPLGMALCPPRDPNQKLWTGDKPSKQELAIWNHTVKIAVEAVLFPKAFHKRTDSLDKRYFYTSGMGQFYKMTQDTGAKIEGRPLSKSSCIEIWKEG